MLAVSCFIGKIMWFRNYGTVGRACFVGVRCGTIKTGGVGKGVAMMRGMKRPVMMTRWMARMAMHGKHELMVRRATNHNAHVITPHGKVVAGRKGRKV